MTTIDISREIQEIAFKLSATKPKQREEGILLLNTLLSGQHSITFCRYISKKTAELNHNQIPHSETWPFLIKLLIQCVKLEVSGSKKRLPKSDYAKTLKIVIQRANDSQCTGHDMLLLPVAKLIFNHIWEVLKDVPSFQSDYGSILRHLLRAQNYRFHMRNRIYCCLVRWYLEKVETSATSSGQLKPTDDVIWFIRTLQLLFENPPEDYSDDLREDVVKGFAGIFSYVSGDGKIIRILIECVNSYLLKDGPNLGSKSLEIHEALEQCFFQCWKTAPDHGVKDVLVYYARLQMNLVRGSSDASTFSEKLIELLLKELEHMYTSTSSSTRNDITKDDKYGTLTSSQRGMLELSAHVFHRACISAPKAPVSMKRARREHVVVLIKEGLEKGKWPWHAVFCFLMRNYGPCIREDLLSYCFETIHGSLDRIIRNANMEHLYDGLLWTLRSLHGLSSLLFPPVPGVNMTSHSSHTEEKFFRWWHDIWSCLMRCLPIICTIDSVADAALMLVHNIIVRDTEHSFALPTEFWDLQLFKRCPSIAILRFLVSYFSRRAPQLSKANRAVRGIFY